MTPFEERRWRLTLACNMRRWQKQDLATALVVTSGALAGWERRGDPSTPGSAVTAATMGALLRCPPEALLPGGPLPTWEPIRADVAELVALGDELQSRVAEGVALVREADAVQRRLTKWADEI